MISSENELRDFLFENHKENFVSLIIGRREPVQWTEPNFPPIHFLLQQRAEKKINEVLDSLESLVLVAKELRLEKSNDSTTRVDLFGNSEDTGLAIIELKKSKQTERQAFTELLAYANHFCSIFPGLKESAITSILVAPMETRTVRDAYVQELVANNKNIVALIPEEQSGKVTLEVFYPNESYYRWFENNLLDDRSMLTVAVSFPEIKGWIDTDLSTDDQTVPQYTKDALNTISNVISHKLEADGYHALVYASQQWGAIGQLFPFQNTIVVAAINPFASFRTSIHKNEVYGESENGRLEDVQSVHDQLNKEEQDFWIETMEASFHNRLIGMVREEFDLCFKNKSQSRVENEISCPDWYGLKNSPIDTVFAYNLDIYLTGLIREIYLEYVEYVYSPDVEYADYYNDDIPQYSYKMLRNSLAVWTILRGLGFGDDKPA